MPILDLHTPGFRSGSSPTAGGRSEPTRLKTDAMGGSSDLAERFDQLRNRCFGGKTYTAQDISGMFFGRKVLRRAAGLTEADDGGFRSWEQQ